MPTTGQNLPTRFAAPERETAATLQIQANRLRESSLCSWFDALPVPMLVLNDKRQILYCNAAFSTLSLRPENAEVLGLRPGEALNCVHAHRMEAGCGCSDFCSVCGAAIAILKCLEGEPDCQECRMLRLEQQVEVPLDLQVFTRPVTFEDMELTALFVLDISHEKKLAYLNRTFHHKLINGVGGINALTELLDPANNADGLLDLLADTARGTLKHVMYHRDIEAAEAGRLSLTLESFDADEFIRTLVQEQCRQRNTQENCTEISSSGIQLVSDKRVLGHILGNMLENALEAREATPGQIHITCTGQEDGSVAITMRNPGTVPPDIHKQMFKRYVSSKSRDRGLGAYVVKLFTQKYLGGTVTFSSGDGETSFTVTLPAQQ